MKLYKENLEKKKKVALKIRLSSLKNHVEKSKNIKAI